MRILQLFARSVLLSAKLNPSVQVKTLSPSLNFWTRVSPPPHPASASPVIVHPKVGQQEWKRTFGAGTLNRIAFGLRPFSQVNWSKSGEVGFLKRKSIPFPQAKTGNFCRCITNYTGSAPGKVEHLDFPTGRKMIVYSRISESDIEKVTKHMLDGFYKNEPFGLALGADKYTSLTMDQVEFWFPQFLRAVLTYYEPVSFKAVDSETNEVIGVIINIIWEEKRKPPPSMKQYLVREKCPVKWQICQFLEDLEEGVDAVAALNLVKSKENKIFMCLFVSVYPEYGGKGIARTLIRESEEECRKHLTGVTIAMTDVTSQFSYLAFKKLGYELIKEVQYLSYKDPDGIPIFEGKEKALGVHTHARVVAKRL